ncbi:hypothetical protein IT418_03725 [bacterium]|nr:hypothetical protein [bacterium]
MGLLSWFNWKRKISERVEGTLSYIPGSKTPNQDEPIVVQSGQLVKRMYVQPEERSLLEHSNIRIYTGNPFRAENLS